MNILAQERSPMKVRVYLISAQNLTATGVKIDLKSKLAGFTALSTANPYPVVQVGDGRAANQKQVKSFNDRDIVNFDGELNPKIFKMWEMDA